MVRLVAEISVAVFMVLILGVGSEQIVRDKRDIFQIVNINDFLEGFCNNNPLAQYLSICNAYTTTTTTSTTTTSMTTAYNQSSTSQESTPELEITTTTASASALERAHWCRFSNGTYIPLGYTFMHSECALCQCTQSHLISCTNLQCMPTYCIDNSVPSTRPGQCCSQCGYEQNSTACLINGINFPDGTILRTTKDGIVCWCQLGTVECRKYTSSLFSSLDVWGEGTAVYVIVIVICVMLLLGTLLCSGGALFFYYFYKRNQLNVQQAYEQYYNNAGWQPMGDQGLVDGNAEKEAEAEQNQYESEHPTGNTEQHIPPPYALYNGSYINQQNEKHT